MNQRFIEPYLNISNSDFWLSVQQAASAQIHILALGSVIGFQIAVNHRRLLHGTLKNMTERPSLDALQAYGLLLCNWDPETLRFSHECVSVCSEYNYWSNKIKKSSVLIRVLVSMSVSHLGESGVIQQERLKLWSAHLGSSIITHIVQMQICALNALFKWIELQSSYFLPHRSLKFSDISICVISFHVKLEEYFWSSW